MNRLIVRRRLRATRPHWHVAGLLLLAVGGACAPGSRPESTPSLDAPQSCEPPRYPAGPEVELAPPFDSMYRVYDLGPVPGVPNPLGGTAILPSDPNMLLIAGGSESADGAIYSIGVSRDACGHIIDFAGTATRVADAPHVDANLVFVATDLVLYTEWPQFTLSQLAVTSPAPDRRTDLRDFGMIDERSGNNPDFGPGGLGRVPPGLAAAGGLRLVTYPAGRWYHVATSKDGNLLAIDSILESVTVPNLPGGFAYVPAGSPSITHQSIIVAEWPSDPSQHRVAIYEVDQSGDPVIATRREFFHRFANPWGAYFEPVTGDYMFLSWGTGEDRIYIVQGFVPPPTFL